MLRVGFVGLGKMGLPMCRNLIKAGFPLTVYNRSRAAVDQLASEGATAAGDATEVAQHSDIVLTCLPDPDAVEEVYLGPRGIMEATREGQVLVDHSTVGPKTSVRLYETAKAKGAGFLDAPVSGGPSGAASATLTIMAGGDEGTFQQALPLFKALGQNIHHVGPAGCGTIVKLANQLLVAIHTVAVTEALVLTAKAGGDPATMLEVIGSSYGASAMLIRHGPLIMERRFEPGTPVDLILKDLRLIEELAGQSGVRSLMGALAKQAFTEASSMGLGAQDMAALIKPLERLAGTAVGPSERLPGTEIGSP
ncbi:MAG: NAD(P)-dependent oxidoreductase [Chloroflexi bacterium]|nr:NAD(P)-dependent oxidoreductase [Chloroflexota bacterium]